MTTFGAVAYDLGLVTLRQLSQAVSIQKQAYTEGDKRCRLGEIFVGLGHLTTQQVVEVLQHQRYLQLPVEIRLHHNIPPAS